MSFQLPRDFALAAQEASEDQYLRNRSREINQERERYSCPEDNETTPWLKRTQWPVQFQDRPLDLITASAMKPRAIRAGEKKGDYHLGNWRGLPITSPASHESRLRTIVEAATQMFLRMEATLAKTSYRFRCRLKSYKKDHFYPQSVNIHTNQGSRANYLSIWIRFLCYICRVSALKPSQQKKIFNLKFQADEAVMIQWVLSLAEQAGRRMGEVLHRGEDNTSQYKEDEDKEIEDESGDESNEESEDISECEDDRKDEDTKDPRRNVEDSDESASEDEGVIVRGYSRQGRPGQVS